MDIIDTSNVGNTKDTLIVCLEGITGSGKSSLIAEIKKVCRSIGRPHDVYIDRYSASLWVYGRDIEECLSLEKLISSRGLYIYLTLPLEIAWKRESDAKKSTYNITKDLLAKTEGMFNQYFTEHCTLPVIVRNSSSPIDCINLLEEIDHVHEERMAGYTLSPFKA